MPRPRRAQKQSEQSLPASPPQPAAGVSQEHAPRLQEPPVSPPPRTKRGRRMQQDPHSMESFDLSNLSDTSSDDRPELLGGQAASPWSHSRESVVPTTAPRSASPRPASPVLLAPPPVKAPRNFADDILYFFNRGSKAQGTSTLCKFCK